MIRLGSLVDVIDLSDYKRVRVYGLSANQVGVRHRFNGLTYWFSYDRVRLAPGAPE
jgi:hypothetical protein